jgi:uncharacterized protein YfaP (DUF2135 family)
VLTVSRTLPGDFVIYFAAVAADGTQSVVATQRVRRVSVGSGDVQVSVSWDTPTDTDLHVIEPDGTELWARNGRAETLPSTGHLDLDSNQSCDIDGTNNENATWQHAPPGHYIVRVVYYSVCGTTNVTTHYVVTVQVVGHPTQVVDGTFGPDDADAGEAGAGRTVATFDVA